MLRLCRLSWDARSEHFLRCTWASPLGPCISKLGCGILLRKGLGGDWLFGSANIFLKGEGLRLSETLCLTFLSTSCHFFGSRVWCAKGWKKLRGTFYGVGVIWRRSFIW